MANKKILVIHFVHTLYGGVASVAAELMNKQYKDGITPIVVYTCDNSALENMLDFKIDKIKVNMKLYPGYSMLFGMSIRKIYNFAKKKYPGYQIIIHAHNVQTVGLLSNIRGIPMICTLHSLGGDEKSFRRYLSDVIYRNILNKIMRNGGRITSVSYAIINYYNKHNKKITVIHNGINRNIKKISHDKFVIAHVGNISKAKGWDIVCDGFAMIPNEIREKMEFVSVGKTATYSEEYIKRMFSEKGISNEAKYLGFIDNAGTRVIPRIDLLVLASRNEGLGLVQIEAMSLGIPVLGTDVGGICEVLKDGYNGFVIKTPEDIKNRIIQLYTDQELYNKLCENAMKTYKGEFDMEIVYRKYKKIYMEILDTAYTSSAI